MCKLINITELLRNTRIHHNCSAWPSRKLLFFQDDAKIKICHFAEVLIILLILSMYILPAFASRDPTKPPTVIATTAVSGNFKLDAIFSKNNPANNVAIIKGASFMVGDKVAGATIIAIKPNEVKLRDSNGDFIITMPYLSVKSPITRIDNNKKKNLCTQKE